MAGYVAARGQGRCHRRRRSPGEANTGLASEVNAPEFIEQLSGAAPSHAKKAASCSAGLQPVNCIVTDEVLSVGMPYFDASKHINHTFTLSSSTRRIVI